MRRLIFLFTFVLFFIVPQMTFADSTVVKKSVSFRSAPSTNSTIYTYLEPGTQLTVIEEINKWWIKVQLDKKVGYVSRGFIGPILEDEQNHETTILWGVNLREEASASSQKYRMLSKQEKIHVVESIGNWLKVKTSKGEKGYISANQKYSDYITEEAPTPTPEPTPVPTPIPTPSPEPTPEPTTPPPSPSNKGQEIATKAQEYLGQFTYQYGAEPWTSNYQYSDCSGFVQLIFNKIYGYHLPRTSAAQSVSGTGLDMTQIEPGDLVFFDTNNDSIVNHVGIYIGGGQFVHSSPSNSVGISSLLSGYWKTHYIKARRVI